jgi:acetyl-CoA carboxylase biotin carboxyl carrier protein
MAEQAERIMTRRKRQTVLDFSAPEVLAMLSGWLEQAGVHAIEIEREDQTIKIAVENGAPQVFQQPAARSKAASFVEVKAPFVGHFLPHHPARDSTRNSTSVDEGDIVGFVKVGPLLLGAAAPKGGIVRETLVSSGDLVGYADALLMIEQK